LDSCPCVGETAVGRNEDLQCQAEAHRFSQAAFPDLQVARSRLEQRWCRRGPTTEFLLLGDGPDRHTRRAANGCALLVDQPDLELAERGDDEIYWSGGKSFGIDLHLDRGIQRNSKANGYSTIPDIRRPIWDVLEPSKAVLFPGSSEEACLVLLTSENEFDRKSKDGIPLDVQHAHANGCVWV